MIECQQPSERNSIPRLGRLAAVDERDRRFNMAAPRTDRTFRNWLTPGEAWDQGYTSECVAYASNRWLISHRVVNRPPLGHNEFYRLCKDHDEWPGSDYDGTSVRAAFKILKMKGFVSRYSWAWELEPMLRHVLEIGPVVVGTDWTHEMFFPDRDGYIWPKGWNVGGHAWLVTCVNRRRQNPDGTVGAVRCWNSWGPSWGQYGRAWVTFDVMQQLIDGLSIWPGEVCTADEVKL